MARASPDAAMPRMNMPRRPVKYQRENEQVDSLLLHQWRRCRERRIVPTRPPPCEPRRRRGDADGISARLRERLHCMKSWPIESTRHETMSFWREIS